MTRRSKPDPQKRTRILVADDHPMVRERMTEVIRQQRDLEVCGEATEAGQVFGMLAKLVPDVLLLDLNLKGVLALDLIRDIKVRYPSLPVVVVSMHDES